MRQRQQESVVVNADVKVFELGGGHVQVLQWKLNVRECQLAEMRRIVAVVIEKRVERGEFVVEHGCLELLLAFAQLLRELAGLFQVQYQLVVTCLDTLKIFLLLGEERSHPLSHIFDNLLGGLLSLCPAGQALAFVSVDLGHQRVGCLVDALEGDLTCQVDLVADRVAMLANRHLGLFEHLGQVGSRVAYLRQKCT